jgi:hypothetical protein
MKTAAILQPGSIGDIIICMPLARHYADLGYRVLWPIRHDYMSHFQYVSPYVEWLSIPVINKSLAIDMVRKIAPETLFVDTYFGFPDCPSVTQAWLSTQYSFDEYKYKLAGFSIDMKYALQLTRSPERENRIRQLIGNPSPGYVCIHTVGSSGGIDVRSKLSKDRQIIEITPKSDCIFDWLGVMENASEFHMVDSCFSNLASQYFHNISGVRYWKPGYPDSRYYPKLNPKWKWL